jgi:hypothetical protein
MSDGNNPPSYTIECPKCHKKVEIIQYGGGYLAVCCGWVIYNNFELPDVIDGNTKIR